MNKKLYTFLFLLLVVSTCVFAGGNTELLSSIGTGMAAGAGMGSVFGPAGILIGAGAGALFGGVTGSLKQDESDTQNKLQYEELYNQSKSAEKGYETELETLDIQQTQAERQADTYNSVLAEWDSNVALEREQYQAQGDSKYSELMNNFSNIETIISAKGQTGGSAAIVADIAKQDVQSLAGDDMTMNRNGNGIFAKVWDQTERDLSDEYSSTLTSKQDIYSVMENYRANKKSTTENLTAQQKITKNRAKDAKSYGSTLVKEN